MNRFFGKPTKIAVLVLLTGWLLIATATSPVVADEREPILSVDRGAVQFFPEIAPSIVQVGLGTSILTGIASGSGYIIDREGHLITNRHVTEGEPVFEIAFFGDENNPRSYVNARSRGTLVGEDPTLDLAVVKVDAPPEKFHPIRLADSAAMKPGDTVATFGSPGGGAGVIRDYVHTELDWLEYYNLNVGVVAEVLDFEEAFWVFQWMGIELGERAGVRDYGASVQYLFHVDSAINSGNSGGPSINMYGEAIGTNTWGGGGENMGFSVPVNLLKDSVAGILEYGRPRHPWCGIALHPPYRRLQAIFLPEYSDIVGAPQYKAWFDPEPDQHRIYTVNPYSAAYAAGLREGDVVTEIDGQTFRNVFDFYSYILNKDIGDQVVIEYDRNDHGMPAITVTLDEKRTRYFGSETYVGGFGPYTDDLSWYTSDLTY